MLFHQIIDLSHQLRPGHEARRLSLERLEATQITGAPREEGWYVMHYIGMDNHLGTHLEVPYHCLEDGADLAQIPAQQYVAQAVRLDVRGYGEHQAIPLDAVQEAATRAGGIRQGDAVVAWTGWSRHYGTPTYLHPPYLSEEALRWVVGHGIKMYGIDTPGAMNPDRPDRLNHLPLFEAGVVYIESLTNLEQIPQDRFLLVALPPAIAGLEGITVRAVAVV
ncbi:MAG: hypothetical protein D6775_01200 [Caldilineae bacterium]|nr:MAG: hypothetical protein D6775_01200 [Caldilineae bacterium]